MRGQLPHFDQPGVFQMITFRLADSLPATALLELAQSRPTLVHAERRRRIEAYLDAGHGACRLRDDRIARIVVSALHTFDNTRYRLIAWVIMPNHVHVLIETFAGFPLVGVIQSWKSFTANETNRILGRSGAFWQPDYFDRAIRDERHYLTAIRYIHENPVKAGLAAVPEEYPYSSARGYAASGGAGILPARVLGTRAGRMPAPPDPMEPPQ